MAKRSTRKGAVRVARAGQVVSGPHTKIVFLETSADTGGERLTFRQTVQPGAPATPGHAHIRQVETFRVLAGTMGVRAAGVKKVFTAGQEVTVPAGVLHAMWNAGEVPLEQEIKLEPALRSETFFETVLGLERDGRLPHGRPTPGQVLQVALLAPFYDNFFGTMPVPLQRIPLTLLKPLAGAFGYRPWYELYSPYGPVR